MSDVEYKPSGLVDKAALEHFKTKKILPGFSHYDVWLYQHSLAFTVAKMMDADMLAEVKQAIEQALQNGTSFADFKKRLKPYLMAKGWWGEQIMTDPLDEVQKLVQLGSTRRLKTIFNTNMQTAFAAGQWQRIQANKAALPYLRYNASAAGTPRDSHKRYYGLILPVDHEIWNVIFPPNGYGCKCSVSALTRRQAEREGISGEPDVEMLEFTNPRTGQTVLIPDDITPSFAHNHGDRLGAMNALFADKHGDGFVARVAAEADRHVFSRVVRPNFLSVKPELTVLDDGKIPNAQALVYSEAGRGYQLGYESAGHYGSQEVIERDGKFYIISYDIGGVNIEHVSAELLETRKTEAIMVAVNGLDGSLPDKMAAKIKDADFGGADFADKLAAYLYTTNAGYKKVNPRLIENRGKLDGLTNDVVQITRAIDRFLEVSPKYQGVTKRMVNSNKIPDLKSYLIAHTVGNMVRYSNFTSTALSYGTYGKNLDIELTIHGRNGVKIEAVSAFGSTEAEVLMPRSSVYKVVSRTETDGKYFIGLEEITGKGYDETLIIQLSDLRGRQ
ncbi:phage minor head protein [Neisseria yangbaofengii]|uniref:phage minor head protein n=1 Tax=Neisseria yangbaofengii TaxID=2709396 RepID=UPI0013EA1BF3|nr:phage minor head protein [Neisseria yangbaofengii]